MHCGIVHVQDFFISCNNLDFLLSVLCRHWRGSQMRNMVWFSGETMVGWVGSRRHMESFWGSWVERWFITQNATSAQKFKGFLQLGFKHMTTRLTQPGKVIKNFLKGNQLVQEERPSDTRNWRSSRRVQPDYLHWSSIFLREF